MFSALDTLDTRPAWPARGFSGAFVALLYVAFGLTDLILSLAAFAFGIPEGNPVLAWLGQHSLFVTGKLLFTAVAAVLIASLYHRAQVRPLAHGAVVLMAAVDLYHIWAINALLSPH